LYFHPTWFGSRANIRGYTGRLRTNTKQL
jgi:hypothetical protein